MPVPWLEASPVQFPPLDTALEEPNGLLAAGAALSPQWLLAAYRSGIFPWYEEGQSVLWWSPDPRLVLFPDRLRISKSLRKFIRKHPYTIYINRDFSSVVEQCGAERSGASGTWITADMQAAYCQLNQLGHAHSVEVWRDDDLVGGLYGIAMGKVFFGESMFSKEANTSKLALVALISQLTIWDFQLIDCQVTSDHLLSLGAEEIPRSQFTEILAAAATENTKHSWPKAEDITAIVNSRE